MRAQWILWRKRRAVLVRVGYISAIFFFFFALALLDGGQKLVRTPSEEIVLFAGTDTGLSGPCPFPNPVASVKVRPVPKDTGLTFTLEGFFAGYMLGNGMWRGRLSASPDAHEGLVPVTVSFRGAPKGQRFSVQVFTTQETYRRASPSFCVRFLGVNPFWTAGTLFLGGLIFGSITLVLGRKNAALLVDLGFAEIFRVKASERGCFLWCSAHASTLGIGAACPVVASDGHVLGVARITGQQKSVFCLESTETAIADGCLVCVCPEKGGVDGLSGDA